MDQTLCSPYCRVPDSKVFQLKEELNACGIEMIVISNNFVGRVRKFCKPLDVRFLPFALKFTPIKVRRFLKELKLSVSDCIFVGDQIRTDGKLCHRLGADLILTEPLDEKDNFFTRFHRKKDRRKIRVMKEKNELGIDLPVKGGK